MAIDLTVEPLGLIRTAGLISPASDYTVFFRINIPAIPPPGDNRVFWVHTFDNVTYSPYIFLGQDASGNLLPRRGAARARKYQLGRKRLKCS